MPREAKAATRLGGTRWALDIADRGPQQTVMSAGFQVRAEAAGLRRETAEVALDLLSLPRSHPEAA
jgi:hypothetical protein